MYNRGATCSRCFVFEQLSCVSSFFIVFSFHFTCKAALCAEVKRKTFFADIAFVLSLFSLTFSFICLLLLNFCFSCFCASMCLGYVYSFFMNLFVRSICVYVYFFFTRRLWRRVCWTTTNVCFKSLQHLTAAQLSIFCFVRCYCCLAWK